jgi:hypothetical protein
LIYILVDSDVPDSLISPTDEETCSYITEEEFCAGGDGEFGDIVSCSDFENVPVSLTVEDAQPALRFSAFPDMPPVSLITVNQCSYLNYFCLNLIFYILVFKLLSSQRKR